MRILDLDNDKPISNIILYLKIDEAKELLCDLNNLVLKNNLNLHAHVNDIEYQHEITIVLYNEKKLDMLDERSQQLIKEDR